MKREQDKRPDFLKDLNAGILDELTKNGKAKNAVGLAGELTEIEEVSDICGLPFTGYLGKIETPRPSGIIDEVVIAIEKSVAVMQGGIAFEAAAQPGSRLLLSGKMQTLKDFESGRVLVFVLADYVAVSPKAMLQNDIALVGELAYTPRHRKTPRGKRITDIFVKVQNVLTAGTCFIPCICWQETADEVANWQQGDKVILLGRYQSRKYEKVIDTDSGSREQRTAYEVSVQLINKITVEAGKAYISGWHEPESGAGNV